jgi:hypothetical protein
MEVLGLNQVTIGEMLPVEAVAASGSHAKPLQVPVLFSA